LVRSGLGFAAAPVFFGIVLLSIMSGQTWVRDAVVQAIGHAFSLDPYALWIILVCLAACVLFSERDRYKRESAVTCLEKQENNEGKPDDRGIDTISGMIGYYLHGVLPSILIVWIVVVSYVMYTFGSDEFSQPLAGILPGVIFGHRRGLEIKRLPGEFVSRYLPFILPALFVAARAILRNFLSDNDTYRDGLFLISIASCASVSYAVFFAIGCSLAGKRPSEKRFAAAAPACAIIAVLSVAFSWQSFHYYRMTFTYPYRGGAVADDVDLKWYMPEHGGVDRLARLDEPPSFRVTENIPRTDGATAFFPIYSAVINAVCELSNGEYALYVRRSKTPAAYEGLIGGKTDLIFALRPSEEQISMAQNAGVELRLTPIARDAFVFFVNEGNAVSDLSVEQIQDIYRNKIRNWRQVGGPDVGIIAFQRPNNSGSQTTMIHEVMKGGRLPAPLREEYYVGGMVGVIKRVANYRDYPGAIGYSFRFFVNEMFTPSHRPSPAQVKLLSIDGIAPTKENIRSGAYPFTVEIYAVTAGAGNPNVPGLIEWILSPQGQALVEKTGYVGVPPRGAD
jgi:phosphate transport system substrate-binding protein